MLQKCAITTIDNPFNPIDDFDKWNLFDVEKGYCSSAYLARVARTSGDMSDEEYYEEISRAIDEIIAYDFTNTYKKVTQLTT